MFLEAETQLQALGDEVTRLNNTLEETRRQLAVFQAAFHDMKERFAESQRQEVPHDGNPMSNVKQMTITTKEFPPQLGAHSRQPLIPSGRGPNTLGNPSANYLAKNNAVQDHRQIPPQGITWPRPVATECACCSQVYCYFAMREV